MRKIILILLPLLAIVGGAFGGDILKARSDGSAEPATSGDHATDETAPDAHAEVASAPAADHATADTGSGDGHGESKSGGDALPTDPAWVAFPNQFFVPVVRNGDLGSFMILTVTLQTTEGARESVTRKEHQLRDALLRRLMAHANSGGFDGNFTSEDHMRGLRDALLAAAQGIAGPAVTAILIEDIGRQES